MPIVTSEVQSKKAFWKEKTWFYDCI